MSEEQQENQEELMDDVTADDLRPPREVIRREVRNNGQTEVVCVDEPGPGGACHEYLISQEEGPLSFFLVMFQKGPIANDDDVNGCQIEDLIAICMDRLEGFQSGDFPCDENANALFYLKQALQELDHRTADRIARNVEGTNVQ